MPAKPWAREEQAGERGCHGRLPPEAARKDNENKDRPRPQLHTTQIKSYPSPSWKGWNGGNAISFLFSLFSIKPWAQFHQQKGCETRCPWAHSTPGCQWPACSSCPQPLQRGFSCSPGKDTEWMQHCQTPLAVLLSMSFLSWGSFQWPELWAG